MFDTEIIYSQSLELAEGAEGFDGDVDETAALQKSGKKHKHELFEEKQRPKHATDGLKKQR